MRPARRLKIVLFLSLLVCLSPASSWAQSASNADPPVAVGGFAYQLVGDGTIHMNICQQEQCVPGSKVSYRLLAPTNDYSFEEFKQTQEMVRSRLLSQLPEGTAIRIGEPERTENERFTTFTITREMTLPDGTQSITKSAILFAKEGSISLISSSESKKAAEANSALFMMALMLWAGVQEQKAE